MSKRRSKTRFLLKSLLVLVLLAGALGVYARFIEPKTLIIRNFDVAVAGWSGAPLTIAVLSDTHVGGVHVDAARVGRIMEKVRELEPDMILLAGDYVSGHQPKNQHSAKSQAEIRQGLQALASGQARYGTYAVLGNHDWWYDGANVRAVLEANGVSVLTNEVTIADLGNQKLQLAGIGDVTTGHDQVPELLARLDPDLPVFTLTHNPDVLVNFPAIARINFAAHTHGGQVWLPILGRPGVPSEYGQRFARGRYQDDAGIVMVTSGIGTSLLPIRFMTRPEIMVVHVVAG